MRTAIDCIPCFFRQTIETCRFAGLPENKIKEIVDELALRIPSLDSTSSPPAAAQAIHRIIRDISGNPDPYKEIKRKSNEIALAVYPDLKNIVLNAENRLLKAIETSIAGNIIDYGAFSNLNIRGEIDKIINSAEGKTGNKDSSHFAFDDFADALGKTKILLYLADNAGEIVFDRILMEEIKASFPDIRIYCAVRGNPIMNDCLTADALSCGIDSIAKIISNGTDAPGTILDSCSAGFLEIWNKSDLIVSKGQGNFESLSCTPGNIFFLFIVKCQPLAKEIGCKVRDVVFLNGRGSGF